MKLPKELTLMLPPDMQASHWIEDMYGNQYVVLDLKQNDGKWHGYIVNKRSGKSRHFSRNKKKSVWEILDRNYDKSNLRWKKNRNEESK